MNAEQNIGDSQLLNQIRQGGNVAEGAIEILYTRYRNEVLFNVEKMIRYRRGRTEDTRDLVQDAYIILLRKVRSENYEEGSIRNFWIGIAKGLFKNKQKKDYRVTFVGDPMKIDEEDLWTPELEMEQNQRMEFLEKLLSEVGDKCKMILKLAMRGYSMKEIAGKMELASEGMARKTKYQCKKKLVELVKELNIEI